MTVYFMVKDKYARQLLKNVQSINIENYIYHFGLIYFKTSNFNNRKNYKDKFISFNNKYIAAKVMEITFLFNLKSAFKQNPDKIIIKF